MDTKSAILLGLASRGNPVKVFDWDRAAQLIKEHKPGYASAGLAGDFDWTGGTIWDGKPILDEYTFLASTWAIPVLVIDGDEIDCWCYKDERGFTSSTKWPASALKILED